MRGRDKLDALRAVLACPACHGSLAWEPERIACESCASSYPLVSGIPVLRAGERASRHKEQQSAFFDSANDEYEIERPFGTTPLYEWLIAEKARRSLEHVGSLVRGGTAVSVCGGSGMDAEFLAEAGLRTLLVDISLRAAQRARERSRRHGFPLLALVADAEALPFRQRSVDLVYVHDGLHHLEDPLAGLREMARVARVAVSVNEPAAAAVTNLAKRVRLAADHEEAGNYIARLEPSRVAAELSATGFCVLGVRRYAMFYRHEPGIASRVFSREPLRTASVAALRAFGPIGRRIGNKLTVQAVRRDVAAPGHGAPGGTARPRRCLRHPAGG